ncbi:TIGR03618 family F420-dependent PPOX class oxidoreductase [Patulibacter sp.]|uniref:TIGR03618 family F420-dependent PPOX class oxidoreductase n=1 Tax=Patulibacter sp. TaxID=1912859 RepID=UPI002716F554|nr:TIGR03618 family F420-dependent PPOX class oxidoreductase [Patulibacter sp.]MDO9407355.1 TIGR03618 family F420-dependent PPOX class oxidoreductase [Patulibacter sp.]
MPTGPDALTADALAFLTERHLGTYTSMRGDGTPHVTAVGFTWDPERGLARVITGGGSQKARNARDGTLAAVCQLDGPRWLTLEGVARATDDPERVAEAVARYAGRYRQPRVNPERVAIEIEVTRVLGSRRLFGG